MKATLKVDVIDRYREPRKIEVPMNAQERKAYRKSHPSATEEDLFKIETTPYHYGKAGDEVTILSSDPGPWKIAVVVANSKDDRFTMKWDELNTHTNEEATTATTSK